jgi:hypothetical protein
MMGLRPAFASTFALGAAPGVELVGEPELAPEPDVEFELDEEEGGVGMSKW